MATLTISTSCQKKGLLSRKGIKRVLRCRSAVVRKSEGEWFKLLICLQGTIKKKESQKKGVKDLMRKLVDQASVAK